MRFRVSHHFPFPRPVEAPFPVSEYRDGDTLWLRRWWEHSPTDTRTVEQATGGLLLAPGPGAGLHLLAAGGLGDAPLWRPAPEPGRAPDLLGRGTPLEPQHPHQRQLRQLEPVLHRLQASGVKSLPGDHILWQHWPRLGRHFSSKYHLFYH